LIPRANITAWRTIAPWPANEQVEQDLVISIDVEYDPVMAANTVQDELIAKLPGKPWKGAELKNRKIRY
jgi:hypothetical protein